MSVAKYDGMAENGEQTEFGTSHRHPAVITERQDWFHL